MMITDYRWVRGDQMKVGYYMDKWLAQNLAGIPAYLRKEWDVVGIVSGRGLVGVGKSTLAMQVGYYVAWMMAGGRMKFNAEGVIISEIKTLPKKEVKFSLDNVVFSPEDLILTAKRLYKHYGKNQVIIYDEGRAGLDSARAMESINKAMANFFQICRMYGHIILIVLPNYFKLHEDYAVSRSLFLIDCFADKNLSRGYFNFYSARQKEWLYFMGKKKIGTSLKYFGIRESFWGRFGKFFPLDKKEYERKKEHAITLAKITTIDKKWIYQRNALLYAVHKITGWEPLKIAKVATQLSNQTIGLSAVEKAINHHKAKEKTDSEKTRDELKLFDSVQDTI